MSTGLSEIEEQLLLTFHFHTSHNFRPPAAGQKYGDVTGLSPEILQFIADHDEVFLRVCF
jgi:hypothetical protein